ncbi:MAG: NifU family protein [Nitrospinaceae bacterium]
MGPFSAWVKKIFGSNNNKKEEPAGGQDPPLQDSKESQFKVVRVQPTPNPDAFQFIMNGPVIASGTKTFSSADEAQGDPLGMALFEIFGVENVFLRENFVTITKSKVVGWHTVMEKLGDTIEDHLTFYPETGTAPGIPKDTHPILDKFKKEDFIHCSDIEKTQIIEALLDIAVRPALTNDGGGINILGIEGNVVKIHYQGACGSCPSSTTGTLTYIENFLKEAIHPDIEVLAA